MEYVTEKADLYELNKKVKSWERKVDIAEVSEESLENIIWSFLSLQKWLQRCQLVNKLTKTVNTLSYFLLSYHSLDSHLFSSFFFTNQSC